MLDAYYYNHHELAAGLVPPERVRELMRVPLLTGRVPVDKRARSSASSPPTCPTTNEVEYVAEPELTQ